MPAFFQKLCQGGSWLMCRATCSGLPGVAEASSETSSAFTCAIAASGSSANASSSARSMRMVAPGIVRVGISRLPVP